MDDMTTLAAALTTGWVGPVADDSDNDGQAHVTVPRPARMVDEGYKGKHRVRNPKGWDSVTA